MMNTRRVKPENIDDYIKQFAKDVQIKLQSLRQTIHNAAPDSEETISYQMPTFKLYGNLVHFAAFKKHIGFYPTSSGIKQFRNELAGYEVSRGTVRFPINNPLPLDLISKIVRFRVQKNLRKRKK